MKTDRCALDLNFTMKQLLRNSCEQNQLGLRIIFINYKEAYDSIDRGRLYEAMKSLRIRRKPLKLVKMILNETLNKIVLKGKLSKLFTVWKSLRRGDPL